MIMDYDFLVVDSGFGGSVAALRLNEKGYSIGVVEMVLASLLTLELFSL